MKTQLKSNEVPTHFGFNATFRANFLQGLGKKGLMVNKNTQEKVKTDTASTLIVPNENSSQLSSQKTLDKALEKIKTADEREKEMVCV